MPNSHKNSSSGNSPTDFKSSIHRKVTAAELETLKEQITDLVYRNPDKAGTLLSLWLKQDSALPQLKKTKVG